MKGAFGVAALVPYTTYSDIKLSEINEFHKSGVTSDLRMSPNVGVKGLSSPNDSHFFFYFYLFL